MNRLAMKREDEHSKVVELEIGNSANKDMRIMLLYVILNMPIKKGDVQHTNYVDSTNLKGDGTSVKFVD